jgi:ATP-dependent Clp protease ATP-binding subunit ClpA
MIDPSEALKVVFDQAVKDAVANQHEYVTLEHLLSAMLDDDEFRLIIEEFTKESTRDGMKISLEDYVENKL